MMSRYETKAVFHGGQVIFPVDVLRLCWNWRWMTKYKIRLIPLAPCEDNSLYGAAMISTLKQITSLPP
jgi:hypothetical protein